MISTGEEVVLKRVAGGSITEHRPLFSSDSLSLYIIWDDGVRQYSTKTGHFVQKLETPTDAKIVTLIANPSDSNLLHAFTSAGELITWKQDTGVFENKKILSLHLSEGKKISGFHWATQKSGIVVVENLEKSIKKFVKYDFDSNEKEDLPTIGQLGMFTSSVGGSQSEVFLATIHICNLRIINLKTLEKFKHKVNPDWGNFTCVRAHPKLNLVATCDKSGRILLWRDIMTLQSIKTLHHWHKLPVNDIVFTDQASSFYSGGRETVLVKWWLDGSDSKEFLPNMEATIKNIVISPDNKYVATGMSDNAINIVNSQMKICQTIQHVSTHFEDRAEAKSVLARMAFDPKTKAIVVNGRSGHVQFYSIENQSYLFLLDVVHQNFLNQERGVEMVNTEVVMTAVSSDGNWLATVEERDDGKHHYECRLKFWSWDWQHRFKLQTSVENPHQRKVNDIIFQPAFEENCCRLISTGMNSKFIIWFKTEENNNWELEFVGKLDELVPRPVDFSRDGSIFAVGFENCLSVWDSRSNEMKSCLTRPDAPERINFIKFGNDQSSRYLVAASDRKISTWDLITLQLVRMIRLKVSFLAANPTNDHMAAFAENGELVVFSPSESCPIFKKKILTDVKVSSALYLPHNEVQKTKISWQRRAQLYFMTENQEIYTLKSSDDLRIDETSPLVFPQDENAFATPLAAFVAKQTLSEVKKIEPLPMWKQQVNAHQGSFLKMMCETPAHMLPPVQLLVGDLIQEYLNIQSGAKLKPREEVSRVVAMEFVEESSSDSDAEEINKKVRKKKSKSESKKLLPVEESNLQSVASIEYDWVQMLFDSIPMTSDEEN
ncbi:WD repeat-containing protein 75 [Neocloeon triangulifer]|uniref:WD repeat-containing protein 75 n=1 Tax=Neocloeon triangulifer TaxID=2078957 RepID=UPI00286F570F|nr:WD repeat-containing protein 75 [Neocloeon triangulifer]